MQFSSFSRIQEGSTIIFYNEIPIENVGVIKYYKDNAAGTFLKKEFRWSFNNEYWSAWEVLTQSAISRIQTFSNYYFFLKVRYTLGSDVNASITTFILNYDQGTATPITPRIITSDIQSRDGSAVIIHDILQSYKITTITDASTLAGYSGAWYLDRSHHTGKQPISSVTDLQRQLNEKVIKTGDTMTGMLVVPDVSGVHQIDFLPNNFINRPYSLGWDAHYETFSFGLPDGGSIQMGQEMYAYFTNLSGTTLVDGDVVSAVSASGNRVAVALCDPKNRLLARAVIGMVTSGPVPPNEKVRVTRFGRVHDLNTDDYIEGQYVYVDPNNPGKLTASVPPPGVANVAVGVITVKHQQVGVISVSPRNIPFLYELSDSSFGPLNKGDFITWCTDTSTWVNRFNYFNVASFTEVPATSSSLGIVNQVAYDSSYLYICTSTNRWGRVSLDYSF